ncbi:uncharacterized protein LOC143247665 [Tachypleus tridentatus]|uniref:uncharacterized protein LOC143247665 n=1 Tax=Tachypleus tridentatus TaxID=6853 RepID=UPI003FD5A893
MNENTTTDQYSIELSQKTASDKLQVIQIHAAFIPPCTKSKVKLLRGILKSRHPPRQPENLLTAVNEAQTCLPHSTNSDTFSNSSISTNLGSNVKPTDVNNANKTSLITTWKHGGTNGRPKVVRIVTPTDDTHTNDVYPSSKSGDAESKEKQSVPQERELGMQPRAQKELLCDNISAIKEHQHLLGPKASGNKVPSLKDSYCVSENPTLDQSLHPPFKTPLSKSPEKSQSEGTDKGKRQIKHLLQRTTSKGHQKTGNLVSPLSSPSVLSVGSPPKVREGITDCTERITGYKSATKEKETKPPLPPSRLQNFINVKLNSGIRGRIASARRQFLEAIQSMENFRIYDGKRDGVRHRLETFKQSTESDRTRLINSSPDLVAIESAVRNSRKHIDRNSASKASTLREGNAELSCSKPRRHAGDSSVVWPDYRQKLNGYRELCKQEKASRRRSRSLGYLETDIDTLECRIQICEPRLVEDHTDIRSKLRPSDKDLENQNTTMEGNLRARSMDFLIDDDNRLAALPPENTLNSTRTLSEYELRIENSLRNLNLPDWYSNSSVSRRSQDGLFLKRDEGRRRPRWQGLGSRTPSSTSLTSSNYSERKLTTFDRMSSTDWRYVESVHSSRDSLTGVSVGSVSPGLSAGSVSPADPLARRSTPLSGWSTYRSFRQPYLGWRAAFDKMTCTNVSGVSTPAHTVQVTNSRSGSPGWRLTDAQFVPSFISNQHEMEHYLHRKAEGATESVLFAAVSENVEKYGRLPEGFKQKSEYVSPPVYHLKYRTEQRNDPTDPHKEDPYSYDCYKTKLPLRFDGLAHNRSPSHQTNTSFYQGDNTPRLYGENSLTNGTSPKFRSSRCDATGSSYKSSVKGSPTLGTSNLEHRTYRSPTNKDFSFRNDISSYGVPDRSDSSHYHKRSSGGEDLKSTCLPEVKDNDVFTEADISRIGEVSILQEKGQDEKLFVSGCSGRTSDEQTDLFSSFIHDFDTWFQRTREFDLERDRLSYIRRVNNGRNVPSPMTEKEILHPTFARDRLHENQNRSTSSPQHVTRSRPTAHVTLVNSEETSTERQNARYEGEKHHDWYGVPDDFEEERENIITSLEDVLDSLLAIPSSTRSSSPMSALRGSPTAHRVVSSAQVICEGRTLPSTDWSEMTDTRKNLHVDTTPSTTVLSGREVQRESPTRRINDIGSLRPVITEKRTTPSFSAAFEPEFESDHSTKEIFPKRKEQILKVQDNKESSPTLKGQVTQHQCQSFQESTEQTEVKFSCPSLEPTNHTSELIGSTDSENSKYESPHRQGAITCNRPKCSKIVPTEIARSKLHMCPNCYTYYCSRHCRKVHWDYHKNQCPYTKISNVCQQILVKVGQDAVSRRNLSVCARRGYLSRGRGAVKLVFYSTDDAVDFMCKGWGSLRGQNIYVPRGEIMPQEMGSDTYTQIRSLCDRYNPRKKFVLLAAVRVTQEMSSGAGALVERDIIIRGTKLQLTSPQPEDDIQTVLFAVAKGPGSDLTQRHQECEAVKRHLQDRGINFATEFPEIFAKIKQFVQGGEAFIPFSAFLTDQRTSKMFMCIISPWADAEIFQNISAKETINKSRRLWML